MSGNQTYKRFPAKRLWIKHILEGNYSEEEKAVYTIFGKVKRVRIVATIIEKRELISNQSSEDEATIRDEMDSNLRIEFDLDDGTGNIRATLWGVDPEEYHEYSKGDIVDITGLIRKWNQFFNLSPEFMKKVEEPNFILLRNADIIKRIKGGEIEDIPEAIESEFGASDMTDEIDIDDLFEDDDFLEEEDVKEVIYVLIKEGTEESSGLGIEDLISKVDLSEQELKAKLRDLEMESRIYQSEQGIYQAYQ